jgi:lysylphosphatidylglycerol synthetase-like protein (DUF2156 family)
VGLLALELVALIVLFAVDDGVRRRPPTATWATSIRVIAAAAVAVAAVTWVQALTHGDIL